MIILNDLDPIFGDNFIEWCLGKHVASFLYRVHNFGLRIKSWCFVFAIVKVYPNLTLVVELVSIKVRHFHLFSIDGLIG